MLARLDPLYNEKNEEIALFYQKVMRDGRQFLMVLAFVNFLMTLGTIGNDYFNGWETFLHALPANILALCTAVVWGLIAWRVVPFWPTYYISAFVFDVGAIILYSRYISNSLVASYVLFLVFVAMLVIAPVRRLLLVLCTYFVVYVASTFLFAWLDEAAWQESLLYIFLLFCGLLIALTIHRFITLQRWQIFRTERELAQAYEELEESYESLDRFARMVAHDLKTPLNGIIGYVDMAREDVQMGETSAEVLDESLSRVRQLALRSNNIIKEILLLAKMQHGRVETNPIEMVPLVAEAQDRVAHHLHARNGTISVAATDWPTAMGHEAWVVEVWVNYLSNAIKYGGEPPLIEVGWDAAEADGQVRFWVQDNGLGLTEAEQTAVFKEFTRLQNSKAEGHGIGLSVVQQAIHKLDGKVGVESEVGQGSRFYFTLPEAGQPVS